MFFFGVFIIIYNLYSQAAGGYGEVPVFPLEGFGYTVGTTNELRPPVTILPIGKYLKIDTSWTTPLYQHSSYDPCQKSYTSTSPLNFIPMPSFDTTKEITYAGTQTTELLVCANFSVCA